jgi:23S rRNA (uracil1939-C5)-methyltransferase
LTITAIGARGDGIARLDGDMVFVPLTVPGDQVAVRIDGRRGDGLTATVLDITAAGPGRQTPPCPLFGRCGGCALQHVAEPLVAAWKRQRLAEALCRAGFAAPAVQPTISIAPGNRRRATFAVAPGRSGVTVGFNERGSRRLVDVDKCLLLAPPLVALLAPLRALLGDIFAAGAAPPGVTGDAVVTLTETGIDLLIAADLRLDLFHRQRLAAFADAVDLARLSWRSPATGLDPVACRRPPAVSFAGATVELPPGAFLQPSAAGEAALAALVTAAVDGADRVADLYAGCGSFSFPLAQSAAVHAVEGDAAAVQALSAAVRRSAARISVEHRDLARRPMTAPELKRFDAVVFDPPRAGAAAQAEILASGGPPLVVAISCNPATLARDAGFLSKGGYRLIGATPVDQFPWSAHIEAVAVFSR